MKYDLCHHEKTVLKVQSYCILRAIHALSITAHVIYEWVLVKVRAVFFGLRWARQVILLLWWSGGMAQGQWCFLGLALSPTHKHHETALKLHEKPARQSEYLPKHRTPTLNPPAGIGASQRSGFLPKSFPASAVGSSSPAETVSMSFLANVHLQEKHEKLKYCLLMKAFLVTEMHRGLQNIAQVLWQNEGKKVFGKMGNGQGWLAG